MDTSDHHHMQSLFEQLGLASGTEQINHFIHEHNLTHGELIQDAKFWSPAQASFLQEAISDDSDWAELVDHLDVALRA